MKRRNYVLLPLIITLSAISCAAFAKHASHRHLKDSIPIHVINALKEKAYFDVCTNTIHPNGRTICSNIQTVKQGSNRIFIPAYARAYPVITDSKENTYTCGTEKDPSTQLFFPSSIMKENTLILDSYILDKDKNRVAVLCVMQKGQ